MMQHEENGTTIDLVRYRLSSAAGDLRAAQILYEAGDWTKDWSCRGNSSCK